jgi:hypothetical protein
MKIILSFCLVLFQALYAFADGNNVSLMPGFKPKDEKRAVIAGLSMDKFGFAQVLNSVLVESNTLIVLGKDSKYEGQLTVIDVAKKKVVMSKKYAEGMMQGRLVGFNSEQAPSIRGFIVIYDVNRSGQQYEETDTYAEAYVTREEAQSFQLSDPVKVAEARIAQISKDGEIIYYSPDGGPARKSMAKLLMKDSDHDGYEDIIIWKKKYLHGRKKDGKIGFYLSEEEKNVLLFDPKSLRFNLSSKVEKASFGKEDLWMVLAPIKYFILP